MAGTDPRSVGRDSGVDLDVVGGTLQAVSGVARINLQLLRVADGVVVWARRWNCRSISCSLSRIITSPIAWSRHCTCGRRAPSASARSAATPNSRRHRPLPSWAVAARELYRCDDDRGDRAIRRSVAVDPRYALARAGLATALAFFSVLLRVINRSPEVGGSRRGGGSPGACNGSWRWRKRISRWRVPQVRFIATSTGARLLSEADRALAINPNLDLAHTARARALFHLGLFDAAEEATARADAGAPRTVENARIRRSSRCTGDGSRTRWTTRNSWRVVRMRLRFSPTSPCRPSIWVTYRAAGASWRG